MMHRNNKENFLLKQVLDQGPFGSPVGTDPSELDGNPQPPLVGEGVASELVEKPPYSVLTVNSGLSVGAPQGLEMTTETRRGRINWRFAMFNDSWLKQGHHSACASSLVELLGILIAKCGEKNGLSDSCKFVGLIDRLSWKKVIIKLY
jgi:hypothetical protein